MKLTWVRALCLLLALLLSLTLVDAKKEKKQRREQRQYRYRGYQQSKPHPPGPAIEVPQADAGSNETSSLQKLEETVEDLQENVKDLWSRVKSKSSSSVAPIYLHVHAESGDRDHKTHGHSRSHGKGSSGHSMRGSSGHGHDRSPRGSHGSSHSSSSSKKSHSSHGHSSYKHGRSGRHGYRGHGPMRSPGHRSGRYGHKSGHDSSRRHKSGGHSVHGYRHGSPRGHSRSHRSPSKSHGHGSPRHHFRGRHSPCGGHGSPRHHYRSHHSPPGSYGHGSPRGHYRSHRSRHSPSGGHGHGPWSRKGDAPGTHVHVHITVDQKPPHKRGKYHPKDEYMYARCDLHDNDPSGAGTITGTVLLRQKPWDETLQVHMNVSGIPGSANGDPDKPRKRGLHVHEFGDFSLGCASFGGHYNPDGVDHAGPLNETRHVGDWNNIEVSPEGVINKYFNISDVHLIGPKAIIGRGIVLHSGEDDLGLGGTDASRATGNAGGRAACCVISWMKSLADDDW